MDALFRDFLVLKGSSDLLSWMEFIVIGIAGPEYCLCSKELKVQVCSLEQTVIC